MKLYVWNQPCTEPYGDTILYVVASDLDEARRVALKGKVAHFGKVGEETTASRLARVELGEPTRVVDLPCAELFVWSE